MRIAIVEENQVVRLGISHIVENLAGLYELISIASLAECQSVYPDVKPDILLRVVGKGEQVEQVVNKFVRKAQAAFPGVFIILISEDVRKATIQRYLASGVRGYLDKKADANELQACIGKVAQGAIYLNVEIIYKLILQEGAPKARKEISRKTVSRNNSI